MDFYTSKSTRINFGLESSRTSTSTSDERNNNTLFNHDKLNDNRDFDSYLNFGKKLTDYLTLYLESTSEDNLTDSKKKKYKQTVSFIAPFLSNQTKLQIANDNANKGVNYSFDLNYENKKNKKKL